jgi:hypothetical protein
MTQKFEGERRSLGDRRRRLRFEIVGQLWGSLLAEESLVLRNIGPGGALLEAPLPLEIDSLHTVRLLEDDQPRDVQARVRHVTLVRAEAGQTSRYLIGVEFLGIPAEALNQIQNLMAGGGRQAE